MGEYTFSLADIIKKTEIANDDIALIRHTVSDRGFKSVWDEGIEMFEEYQKIQPKDYFHGKNYIFSFVGDKKSTARFIGVYKVEGMVPLKKAMVKQEYLTRHGDIHNYEKDYYFNLRKLAILEDLVDRLVIDYGATRNIVHCNWKTIAKKPVIGISSGVFSEYDDIIWTFSDLEKYIGHEERYEDLYVALSKVNGVYLIVDTEENKQYIGSASGDEGIWGRWRSYLKTKGTGGNVMLKEHLSNNPGRYKKLQFSILETIPKTGNKAGDKAIAQKRENLYKMKLLTRGAVNGLNIN